MAKRFIHYQTIKNVLYASVYTPQKINGKKENHPQYLGRVLDKDAGIYQSKERGIFKYTLAGGFSDGPMVFAREKEKLILDFGDAFVMHQVLKTHGYWDLFGSMLPGHEDTLRAMVLYRILRGGASRYAQDWWQGSYAHEICPNARLEPQRVSEFFMKLGDEGVQRRFFPQYLSMVSDGQKNHGILVDSTGMPNDIHFPLTAVNNHNGVVSNETRLILVVDRITRLPLLYRYVAGNIVDVSTLKATIMELSAYGVSVDFSILDAGYYSDKNVKALYGEGIRFVTRLGPNRKLYKDLMDNHLDGLESKEYAVFYRDRLLYIKRVGVELCGHEAYAYVAIDHQRRSDETYVFMKRYADGKIKGSSPDEINKKVKGMGMFAIVSSELVGISEILPLYYTRQAIEQVFDFYKNNVELLPLRVHGEATFRGHLMLSFVSTVAYMLVNGLLHGTSFCAEGAFRALHNLKSKVYDHYILVAEPTKKINDIITHLHIEIPSKIDSNICWW